MEQRHRAVAAGHAADAVRMQPGSAMVCVNHVEAVERRAEVLPADVAAAMWQRAADELEAADRLRPGIAARATGR